MGNSNFMGGHLLLRGLFSRLALSVILGAGVAGALTTRMEAAESKMVGPSFRNFPTIVFWFSCEGKERKDCEPETFTRCEDWVKQWRVQNESNQNKFPIISGRCIYREKQMVEKPIENKEPGVTIQGGKSAVQRTSSVEIVEDTGFEALITLNPFAKDRSNRDGK